MRWAALQGQQRLCGHARTFVVLLVSLDLLEMPLVQSRGQLGLSSSRLDFFTHTCDTN